MAVTTEGLVPELKLRVDLLLAEAKGVVYLNSGYRSNAEQLVLWLKYKAGKGPIAAFPGTSNHNKGLAVDLAISPMTVSAAQLRIELAKKYGLIRTVSSEAWHYELDPKRLPLPQPTKETFSMPGREAIAIESTKSGLGYWIFFSDGGVETFGDAPFYGSLGDVKLSSPIKAVGLMPERDGYLLVDTVGHVYASGKDGKAFGSARYWGGAK